MFSATLTSAYAIREACFTQYYITDKSSGATGDPHKQVCWSNLREVIGASMLHTEQHNSHSALFCYTYGTGTIINNSQ